MYNDIYEVMEMGTWELGEMGFKRKVRTYGDAIIVRPPGVQEEQAVEPTWFFSSPALTPQALGAPPAPPEPLYELFLKQRAALLQQHGYGATYRYRIQPRNSREEK